MVPLVNEAIQVTAMKHSTTNKSTYNSCQNCGLLFTPTFRITPGYDEAQISFQNLLLWIEYLMLMYPSFLLYKSEHFHDFITSPFSIQSKAYEVATPGNIIAAELKDMTLILVTFLS